jgi:hypothetical protein
MRYFIFRIYRIYGILCVVTNNMRYYNNTRYFIYNNVFSCQWFVSECHYFALFL